MKKLCCCILLIDILLYIYLYKLSFDKVAFNFVDYFETFFVQLKPLDHIEVENFKLEDYFLFFGGDKQAKYRYRFEDEKLVIEFKQNDYDFDVSFHQEEKIPTPILPQQNNESDNNIKQNQENSGNDVSLPYFEGHHDIVITKDSDLKTLVSLMSQDIKTNQQVTLYYAEVNLSCVGRYQASYIVGDNSYSIFVEVIE